MNLTDREKEMLKGMIDRGEPLPPKYRLSLFADAPEVELIWQGKTSEVTSVVLPFQSIEQIDEPRAEAAGLQPSLFTLDAASGRQASGWSNKLIWGDNKLVLSSLKNGPLRREIEAAGGLKLIYIDPPFDVGADFSVTLEVGDGEEITKDPSVIEELAYRDTWGRGTDSYLAMVYERLRLMQELLADDGIIYIHVGWQVNAQIKVILYELFGNENVRNEIIWQRFNFHADANRFGIVHDYLLFCTKTSTYRFNRQFADLKEEYQASHFTQVDEQGRRYRLDNATAPSHGRPGKPMMFGDKMLTPPPGAM